MLMRSTFTLSVPQPCHEKWEKFNPTTMGGYCSSCQKEVIDFTSWDEDRIKSFFKKNSNTCGRFLTAQLKEYTLTESESKSLQWLPLSLLSITLIFSNRYAQAQHVNKPATEIRKTDEYKNISGASDAVMQIEGVVKFHSDQSPLPGVNVVLKGTANGTVSDADGKFSITILNPKSTDTLMFSFIGLKPAFHNVYESNELSVFMKEDFVLLGETITVGGAFAKRFSFRNLWWRMKSVFRKKH